MAELPLVLVRWLDAHTVGGWMKSDEYRRLARKASDLETTSVGYLLERTRRALTLVQSISPNNDTMADSITIPIGCVLSVKRMRANA